MNIIGNIDVGNDHGFIDLLAADGHMRWLKPEGDTHPAALRDWFGLLKDFATVFHWVYIEELLGRNKSDLITLPIPHVGFVAGRKNSGPTYFLYWSHQTYTISPE